MRKETKHRHRPLPTEHILRRTHDTRTYRLIYIYIYVCMCVYIYIYTHTHTHTHTHTKPSPLPTEHILHYTHTHTHHTHINIYTKPCSLPTEHILQRTHSTCIYLPSLARCPQSTFYREHILCMLVSSVSGQHMRPAYIFPQRTHSTENTFYIPCGR